MAVSRNPAATNMPRNRTCTGRMRKSRISILGKMRAESEERGCIKHRPAERNRYGVDEVRGQHEENARVVEQRRLERSPSPFQPIADHEHEVHREKQKDQAHDRPRISELRIREKHRHHPPDLAGQDFRPVELQGLPDVRPDELEHETPARERERNSGEIREMRARPQRRSSRSSTVMSRQTSRYEPD